MALWTLFTGQTREAVLFQLVGFNRVLDIHNHQRMHAQVVCHFATIRLCVHEGYDWGCDCGMTPTHACMLRFYLAINVGALIAVTAVVWVQVGAGHN